MCPTMLFSLRFSIFTDVDSDIRSVIIVFSRKYEAVLNEDNSNTQAKVCVADPDGDMVCRITSYPYH